MENAFGQPQSVVVLGGTSDIARAIVRKLCAARAETVVLAGRDPARLAPVTFAAMYPRLDDFLALKARVDPEGHLTSDLARRLHLGFTHG